VTEGFHGGDSLQGRPVGERLKRSDQAAMAVVKFVMDWPLNGRAPEAGRRTELLDNGEFQAPLAAILRQ
jgi:hypothetical protein